MDICLHPRGIQPRTPAANGHPCRVRARFAVLGCFPTALTLPMENSLLNYGMAKLGEARSPDGSCNGYIQQTITLNMVRVTRPTRVAEGRQSMDVAHSEVHFVPVHCGTLRCGTTQAREAK